MSRPALFEPMRLGDIDIANRIVMAPMTRNRAVNTIPGAVNVEYYRQRASAGLIISEATQISQQGVGYPNTPGIHTAEQIAGWQQVTDAVHEAGGKMYVQLWHVGRISHPTLQPGNCPPVAPSAIRPEGETFAADGSKRPFETPRALASHEVVEIVDHYAIAASNAIRAGFDGVEIHAANGYLIDQFLRSGANRREDRYGGSVNNRMRFLLAVTDAVIAVVGAGRTSVRLSPCSTFNNMHDDNPTETFSRVVTALTARSLAFLHVVESHEDDKAFDYDALRAGYQGVYMANDGYDVENAGQRISSSRADLISFGKPFISNSDLPERLLRNAPLACADPATYYGGGAEGYTDYPTLADEAA